MHNTEECMLVVARTAHTITGTGIIASIYDFFVGVREGQFGGYQAHAIIDELRIKSGFDTFDDFTPPSIPFAA
jgi:hypothetical protein